MIVGARRAFPAASILLLGLAASVTVLASASLQPTPVLPSQPAAAVQLTTQVQRQPVRALRSRIALQACFHFTPATTFRSITFPFPGRIFAEEAPPPPGPALQATHSQVVTQPSPLARPVSAPLRNDALTAANRQRAP